MIQIRQSSRLIRQRVVQRIHERRIRRQAMQQQAGLRGAWNPSYAVKHIVRRFGLVFNEWAVINSHAISPRCYSHDHVLDGKRNAGDMAYAVAALMDHY